MNGSNQAGLALNQTPSLIGIELLSERDLTEIEGGSLWAGVGMVLGGGLLACVIGVGVGVGLYYLMG